MNGSVTSIIERSLWLINIALGAILVARLFQLKLARNYRFFALYLLFITVRSAVSWAFDPRSEIYHKIWRSTQPLIWVLYVLIVLEICSLIFKEYRGIQLLGRWAIWGSLIIAVALSSISLMPTWKNPPAQAVLFQRYLMIERGIDFALVILLLLILGFLLSLPIPLSRNVVIHCILYSAFFMSNTMGILLVNVTGAHISRIVSLSLQSVSALCLLSWLTFLTREGEVKKMVLRRQLTSSDEEQLLGQLSTINATLLRASKKIG